MATRFEFGIEFGEEAVAVQGRTARWHAPPRATTLRRLSLADIAAGPAVAAAPPPPAAEPPSPPRAVAVSEAELARACAVVAARARREALQEAARDRQVAETAALEGLARALADLAARRHGIDAALRERLLRWTMAGIAAGLGTLVAADPLASAARVLERLLAAAQPKGALTVLAPPALVEGLRARVPELAAAAGLADEVRVEADPALEPGGVRLEWRDGWADHDPAAWRAALEAELRRALIEPAAGDEPCSGTTRDEDGERR